MNCPYGWLKILIQLSTVATVNTQDMRKQEKQRPDKNLKKKKECFSK